MTLFVSEELLLTELEHLRLMMENLILILIRYLNHLIILLQDQLRAFNLPSFIKVRKNEKFVKRLLTAELCDIGKEHLLSTDQLTFGRGRRLIIEVNEELAELNSAFGRVGLLGRLFQVILVSDLKLAHLRANIG